MREEILSVGIDIGTSTTQLVFSRITLENTASAASVPRISIVDKALIYRSSIYFTPLLSQNEIDGGKVREIIVKEYQKAGIRPSDIHTGAVIITGETARKENAALVLETLSDLAGEFVVATAGPDLEAIIAGRGAGADRWSKHQKGTVINLDIGGGTTNIAVFQDGQVIDTACLDIGGRLIRFQEYSTRIAYAAPKLKLLAAELGIHLEEGMEISFEELEKVTGRMAGILEEVLGLRPATPMLSVMLTGKDLKRNYPMDSISFSGGVADYVYAHKQEGFFKYGDIGILLGKAIGESSMMDRFQVYQPSETIRATVVGAGAHTVEISGSTITYTEDLFPLKNIPILKMLLKEEQLQDKDFSERIKQKVKWFGLEREIQQLALAIRGVKNPSFLQVQRIASSIIAGMDSLIEQKLPLVVVVENDMAKVLGQTLHRQLEYKKEVVCIDGVRVDNGDYIDIGRPLANGRVVPVVIKTLVFNAE
ncbi:Reactivating factor of Adenosylcobalamin-dependent ethanolamine ammonia lyase [Geosporobacter subterraneus DSM 17957]|uniref:Reactivating factor of Adenosylcobalamin-dependent ethanolamine ammonia lyase n=1 Tax=Geosporobacter subterraneus DSM 17957 TaxID=1121919 RepID=A0A1M6JR90_9FIRM|nr:ethanolamine ammonia-lyase reactivating factor EutA [Geosporobacter subterraneus]SHJ49221.1 Reactivating factor of Adenosylcobalamin-dependent ethanolamine ammonia lyase [Geosporobacter subterraneus DSM 17957]